MASLLPHFHVHNPVSDHKMPSVIVHHQNMLIKRNVGEFQTLNEVLITFCNEYGLNPSLHTFEHRRLGSLPMNSPFKLTPLESNAQLELTKLTAPITASESQSITLAIQSDHRLCVCVCVAEVVTVNVAVQVGSDPKKRLKASVPSTSTLWEVLRAVENSNANASNSVNITAVVDSDGIVQLPALHIQRRNFSGLQQLCGSTLSKLGLTGNVLIQCDWKISDPPITLNQLNDTINQLTEQKKKVITILYNAVISHH